MFNSFLTNWFVQSSSIVENTFVNVCIERYLGNKQVKKILWSLSDFIVKQKNVIHNIFGVKCLTNSMSGDKQV